MDAEKIVSIVESASRSCKLRNHPDRADLEQDAAVAVLMAIPKLREEGNPDGYLYQTARNRMLSQLRRHSPVLIVPLETNHHGATMPARLEALGERWSARVRAEVAQSKGGELLATLYGFEGDETTPAKLAAETGQGNRKAICTQALRAMRRLRKSKAIRELYEMATNY
jgi:DNA-directed RNA polymerase specialized sigma24 family protein